MLLVFPYKALSSAVTGAISVILIPFDTSLNTSADSAFATVASRFEKLGGTSVGV